MGLRFRDLSVGVIAVGLAFGLQGSCFALSHEHLHLPFAHPDSPVLSRVRIPGGEFLMGADNGAERDQSPQHPVFLDAYEISEFEITWEEFQAFIDTGGYEDVAHNGFWSRFGAELAAGNLWTHDQVPGRTLTGPQWSRDAPSGPPGFSGKDRWPPRPNDPVIGLSYWEAEAFCRFVGGRLPTEAEWEKAATWGPNAPSAPTRFSWGNDATPPFPANGFEVSEGFSRIEAVDDPRYAGDVSHYGVRGMGGNVSEWVADMYDPDYYGRGPADREVWENPLNLQSRRWDHIDEIAPNMPLHWGIRGGHYGENTANPEEFHATRRKKSHHLHRDRNVGIRVVWDIDPRDPRAELEKPTIRAEKPGAAAKVPAGSYLVGHSKGMPSSGGGFGAVADPQHPICLDDYWIGKFEVTWYEYRKFMQLGGYGDPLGEKPEWWSDEGWKWRTLPPCAGNDIRYAVDHGMSVELPAYSKLERPTFPNGRSSWKGPWKEKEGVFSAPDDHPVMGLSWFEAQAYASFVGGRLPLEVEWEVAASWNPETDRPMQFPWGNIHLFNFETDLANTGDDARYPGYQTAPVGMYPEGVSPFGCYDMAGNVFEWCEDWSNLDSYLYHSPECGADLRAPDFLMLVPRSVNICDPDYWPVLGNKSPRGGGFDPSFVNTQAQGTRSRPGNIGDGYMVFRNMTYGLRVVWDEDPESIPEAQRVRPPTARGTDTPRAKEKRSSSVKRIRKSAAPKAKVNVSAGVFVEEGVIDMPGKEVGYIVSGPPGTLVEVDLDAGAGADDVAGTSPLDAVIEVWHEGIDFPVKVLDDEIVETGDVNQRYSYFDPPVIQHRIPENGSFRVTVRAYSWPAEGSQAGLDRGERSYSGPDHTYKITFNAPNVAPVQDPNGDGIVNAKDVLYILQGFRSKSSKRIKGDLTGDGSIGAEDVFGLALMWSAS